MVCGLVRPGGRQKQVRRVTAISELVKDSQEGQFNDLLVYDDTTDSLVETPHFAKSSSKIADIARQWGLTYDQALANIRARGQMRQEMVDFSPRNQSVLSPAGVVKANGQYWNLVDQMGSGEPGQLMNQWNNWFQRSAPYV